MHINDLKRKLRELKKFEERIRFPDNDNVKQEDYIWNHFFSTKADNKSGIKYSIVYLFNCGHQARKEIFEEFF